MQTVHETPPEFPLRIRQQRRGRKRKGCIRNSSGCGNS
jgi:hypothetical protein